MFPLSEATIKARRSMSTSERLLDHQNRLYFWTNLGLGIALAIGFIVIIVHGGNWTTSIAAFGASLGAGGVLGFLFGVPSAARAPVNITSTGNVAVGTGNNSPTVSADVVDQTGTSPTEPPTEPNEHPQTEPASPIITLAPSPSVAPKTIPPASPSESAPAPGQDTQPPIAISRPSVSNLEQVADWVTKLLLGGGLTQMQRIPPKIWQWAHVVALGIIGDDPKINDRLILAQQAFAAGLLVYGFILGFFSGYLITKLQLGKAIAE
jgi:hypothetical protein